MMSTKMSFANDKKNFLHSSAFWDVILVWQKSIPKSASFGVMDRNLPFAVDTRKTVENFRSISEEHRTQPTIQNELKYA